MKKSIILSLVLIAICSIPVLASEPEQENAPLPTEEDIFLSDLSQLSEEELMEVFGQIYFDPINDSNTYNPTTKTGTWNPEDGVNINFKFIKVNYIKITGIGEIRLSGIILTITGLNLIIDGILLKKPKLIMAGITTIGLACDIVFNNDNSVTLIIAGVEINLQVVEDTAIIIKYEL